MFVVGLQADMSVESNVEAVEKDRPGPSGDHHLKETGHTDCGSVKPQVIFFSIFTLYECIPPPFREGLSLAQRNPRLIPPFLALLVFKSRSLGQQPCLLKTLMEFLGCSPLVRDKHFVTTYFSPFNLYKPKVFGVKFILREIRRFFSIKLRNFKL